MQKNKIFVISILAVFLVSSAFSLAAAQKTPQVPTPSGDVISYAPRPQGQTVPQIETAPTTDTATPKEDVISYVPGSQGQIAPSVASATITGPDDVTSIIENVTTLPAPIYEKDGIPVFDLDGNGQGTTGQDCVNEPIYIAQELDDCTVAPIYLIGKNTADTSGATAATAVGLVVAGLSMSAVGIVCLSKHP